MTMSCTMPEKCGRRKTDKPYWHMTRILIADDHPVVREGLKQILATGLEKLVFGEAITTQELIDRVREEDWDVVVTDLSMPGRGGLDALKEISSAKPKLPVLVV